MPERQVPGQKKQGKADQTRRTEGLNSKPLSQNLTGYNISSYLKGDTPFNPPIRRHATLLSKASSEQRVIITRQLQQTYGNRYVQRLVQSLTVQAKLTVGAADDPYEREADNVADKVMNTTTPSSGQKSSSDQGSTQRQTVPEREEDPVQTKLISRIEEEDDLLLKPLTQRQTTPEKEKELQAKPIVEPQPIDPSGSFDAGSNVEQAIQSQLGGGSPLPGEVRSFMEPRFGADFSNVHVHTGSDASQLNREISAQAFTHGQDIFMGEGKYSPGTGEGKKLLAHELTHVVQQTGVVKRRKPNVASLAKIAPLSNVQRASSTGLAAAKVTGEFAKEAFNYWTDKANAGEPLTSLSDFLIDKVNAKLSYSCQRGYATSGSAGAFSRVTWTITVNTADFSQRPGITKVGDLNQNEVAEIVDTIYHEARHSEQYFRIAKMKAGEKKSADDITKEMSIPKDVAEAAVKSPLKGDVKANKTLIAEAKVWEQITVGKYGEYKGKTSSLGDDVVKMYEEAAKNYPKISDQMNNLAPMITKVETQLTSFFEEEKGKIEKIKKKDGFDKTVLKHIIQIRSAFDKLKAEFDKQRIEASASKDATKYKYNIPKLQELVIKLYNVRYKAYRDFQHEKDTWAVGGAAAKAFKKLKVKK